MLTSHEKGELKQKMQAWSTRLARFGLRLNANKTEYPIRIDDSMLTTSATIGRFCRRQRRPPVATSIATPVADVVVETQEKEAP